MTHDDSSRVRQSVGDFDIDRLATVATRCFLPLSIEETKPR